MNWFFNQSISQFLIIVIMQLGIFSISLSQGITLFHLHMSICVTKRIGFSLLCSFVVTAQGGGYSVPGQQ
jgi:hypothetical protein